MPGIPTSFKIPTRGSHGLQSLEFALCTYVLVVFFVFPLLSLGVMFIRWGLAQHVVKSSVRQLSVCETLNSAFMEVDAECHVDEMLVRLGGVKPKSNRLTLSIVNVADPNKTKIIEGPGAIPSAWLPEGQNCPCQYLLELNVEAEISPLIILPIKGTKIPGLTCPLAVRLASSSHWENLGRDPVTGQYFINE